MVPCFPFLLSILGSVLISLISVMVEAVGSTLISSVLVTVTVGSAPISSSSRDLGSYDLLPGKLPQVLPPPLPLFDHLLFLF